MLSKFKHTLSRHLLNIYGWRTNRKIIVIESDDWGSVRMPSRDVYETALSKGYRVDLNEYEKYDSVLSNDDLNKLFEVLKKFKDFKGQYPIITANCVVANPDFERIIESDFQEYYSESIINTFKKYSNHQNVWHLWQQGLSEKILKFQYHAREHVNVSLLMSNLKKRDKDIIWAINHGMPGIFKKGGNHRPSNIFVEATKFDSIEDRNGKMAIYFKGLMEFQNLFKYNSETIMPTNYYWDQTFDFMLRENGVIGLQGAKMQINPLSKKKFHRSTSKRKNEDFVDLVRNVDFELVGKQTIAKKIISKALNDISVSFFYKKPAIVSMHRINFSGEVFEKNREDNLVYFYDLLNQILKKWPDVEFMSSDILCRLILSHDSHSQ